MIFVLAFLLAQVVFVDMLYRQRQDHRRQQEQLQHGRLPDPEPVEVRNAVTIGFRQSVLVLVFLVVGLVLMVLSEAGLTVLPHSIALSFLAFTANFAMKQMATIEPQLGIQRQQDPATSGDAMTTTTEEEDDDDDDDDEDTTSDEDENKGEGDDEKATAATAITTDQITTKVETPAKV